MSHSFRVILFMACTFLIVVLFGCNGGGDSFNNAKLRTTGMVTLPAGSTLQLKDLQVKGALGVSAITDDGKFTVQEPDTGPALVGLFDKAGRLILFGYVDANSAGGGEINAKQTAMALLFQAIGGYLLPPNEWKKLLELIAAAPETETLAGVIATRVAANPTALLDGDAQIRDAVAAAVATLNPPLPEAVSKISSRNASGYVVSLGATNTVTKVAILNPGKQSGAEVQLNTDGSGIIIANGYRRHLIYYIYRTGYVDKDGNSHDVTPWVELTHNYLTATSGVTSVVSAVTDYAAGIVAYGDTTTQPINLPLEPVDAKRTLYTVVVIGPGADMDLPPALQSASAALKAQWTSSAAKMMALEWFKEFFLPGFFAFVPANGFAKQFELNEANVKFAQDIINMFSQGGLDVGTALASNDYKGTAVNAFKAIAGNESFRVALFTKIKDKMLSMGLTASADAVGNALTKVNVALSLVDKILTGGDIGAVATQLGMSSVYTYWNLAANKLEVEINPNAANATKVGTPINLTCQISGLSGALLNYHWATTGKYGHLEDDRNHSGNAFDTTQGTVRYVPDTIDDGKTDQVTVEAFLVPAGGVGDKEDLGQGTAVITCKLSKSYTIEAFSVDDNMTLWLNGTIIAQDYDGQYAGTRGPFTFDASPGDTIRLQVRDYYGYYAGISDVVIDKPDGTKYTIWPAFQTSKPIPHTVIFDKTWTIN